MLLFFEDVVFSTEQPLRPWLLFSCIIELFDFFSYPEEEKSTSKTLNWIKNDKFDFADENRTYQRPIYAFSVKLGVQKT